MSATLGEFLRARGIDMDQAAVLADLSPATVWRIVNGHRRAEPRTVLRLAQALGVGNRRMQAMCNRSWRSAQSDGEGVPA